MALIYEALGFLVAWFTKRICWVPHRFRYGILCAGAFSNYSDIREYQSNNASRLTALNRNIIATAVIMSITVTLPFNASTDQSLSFAYIAVLVLVLLVGTEIVIMAMSSEASRFLAHVVPHGWLPFSRDGLYRPGCRRR